MYKQSQIVAGFVINAFLSKFWQAIAQKNIQKMVPINVQKMNVYTFVSLAQQSSDVLQRADDINKIIDKASLGIDNLLNSYIKIQRTKRSVTQKSQIGNISLKSINKFHITKTRQSRNKNGLDNSSLYNKQSKINTQRTKRSANNKLVELSKIQNDQKLKNSVNKNQDINLNIQDLRRRLILGQEMRNKQSIELKAKQMLDFERFQQLKQKKKQIQKISYDYDGNFFASKSNNPKNTLGAAAKIHLQLQKQTPKNKIIKIQKLKPNFTTIGNQKLQERKKRIATQQLQLQKNKQLFKQSPIIKFSKSFTQDQSLSEGISIIYATSNFRKFKPLARIGQKITLTQFKREIKNKKFKQFRLKPAKTLQAIQPDLKDIKNKQLNSYKSQQHFVDNNNKNLQLSQKAKHLSEHNKRYKTVFGSEQSSLLESNSRFNQGITLLSSKKGTIKISNQSLYEVVLNKDYVI